MGNVFPERLKYARDKLGVSQEEFSRRLGISRASLTLYENGKRTPDISVLEKIYTETGISLYFLLGLSDVESDDYIAVNEMTGLSQKSIESLCKSERLQYFANTLFEQPEKADDLHDAIRQYKLFVQMCKEKTENDSDDILVQKFIGGILERNIIDNVKGMFDYVTEADRAFPDDEEDSSSAKDIFYEIQRDLAQTGKSPIMSFINKWNEQKDKNSTGEI